MESMAKKTTLAVVILTLILVPSSLLTSQAYTVDSIAKPPVPEFTVRLAAYPYDVPPKTTTTIDQYTGKETTTTIPGYHVENKSIEITIKNPSFTPYTFTATTSYNHETGETYSYVRNVTVDLYYNIQVKGHFGNDNDWVSVRNGEYSYSGGPQSNAQLNSEYTVISVGADYPKDAILDFRVKALAGYYVPYGRTAVIFGYDFYGQESNWGVRTISMSDSVISVSTSPNSTSANPTPTVPELSWWVIVPLLASSLFIAVILTHRNTHKNSKLPFPYFKTKYTER